MTPLTCSCEPPVPEWDISDRVMFDGNPKKCVRCGLPIAPSEKPCCPSCASPNGCIGDPRDFGNSPCPCHTPSSELMTTQSAQKQPKVSCEEEHRESWREEPKVTVANIKELVESIKGGTRPEWIQIRTDELSKLLSDARKEERERVVEEILNELPEKDTLEANTDEQVVFQKGVDWVLMHTRALLKRKLSASRTDLPTK